MAERFIDTSGWAAYICADEQHHHRAVQAISEVWKLHSRVITSTYVLAEFTALMVRLRVSRQEQVDVINQIKADSSVVIVQVEPEIMNAAWTLWSDRLDKDWTLVDCTSFIIMQQLKISEAITTDHHFEQAGFSCLLK